MLALSVGYKVWGVIPRCGVLGVGVIPVHLCPQLVYMGFEPEAAKAALRVFRGSVQLAAQTLAQHGGSLPPGLPLRAEDSSSSTPSTSPSSDSAGGSGFSQHLGKPS